MQVVKGYFDGKAFIPFGDAQFKLKQQAIIVIEDTSEKNDDAEETLAFIEKYKGSIKREIDEKREIENYRRKKYVGID